MNDLKNTGDDGVLVSKEEAYDSKVSMNDDQELKSKCVPKIGSDEELSPNSMLDSDELNKIDRSSSKRRLDSNGKVTNSTKIINTNRVVQLVTNGDFYMFSFAGSEDLSVSPQQK